MRKIGYVGFGDVGRQIQAFVPVAWSDEIHELFFDDELWEKRASNSFAFSSYSDDEFGDCEFFVCLGYKHLPRRAEICSYLKNSGRSLPNLIHPTSYIHPQANLSEGVVVYPHCIVDKGVSIEDGVVVSHDSVIEKCCFLAPRVCISGFCNIGSCSFLGTGTVTANGMHVGKECTIGIGTVVTKNVPHGTSCIGNPMRLLSRHLSL